MTEVPRQDYPVYYDGKQVGKVTSGGFAPYVKEYLAMALVKIPSTGPKDTSFAIEIRGKNTGRKSANQFLKR